MPAATRIVGVLLAAGRGSRFDPSGTRLKLLETQLAAMLRAAVARALTSP